MTLSHGHDGHSLRPLAPSSHHTQIVDVECSSVRRLLNNDAMSEEIVIMDLKNGCAVGLASRPDLAETALVISQRGENIHIAFYDAAEEAGERRKPIAQVEIAFSELKKEFADYRLVFDFYYATIRRGSVQSVQAADQARTELHDVGGNKVAALLKPHGIEMDLQTSRRIFSLLSLRFG